VTPNRIAFATCDALPDGWPDDHPAARAVGATYETWSDETVDWHAYDRVVIRSIWDYTQHLGDFLAWSEHVGPERLRNPPALVAFNADKRYLGELKARHVPTVFVNAGDAHPTLDGEVVVKPNISAGARDTGRFTPDAHAQALELIDHITASGRVALVQPYLPTVDTHGETALVFFAGTFSHALHKGVVLRNPGIAPLADEGHGPAAVMLEDDLVQAGTATEAEKAFADSVIAEITNRFGTPLYARVDLFTDEDGEPILSELEVIEPSLYLATSPGAVDRFAAAITSD
jgi:hypothetical protein